jgi:hypothetical protein
VHLRRALVLEGWIIGDGKQYESVISAAPKVQEAIESVVEWDVDCEGEERGQRLRERGGWVVEVRGLWVCGIAQVRIDVENWNTGGELGLRDTGEGL